MLTDKLDSSSKEPNFCLFSFSSSQLIYARCSNTSDCSYGSVSFPAEVEFEFTTTEFRATA